MQSLSFCSVSLLNCCHSLLSSSVAVYIAVSAQVLTLSAFDLLTILIARVYPPIIVCTVTFCFHGDFVGATFRSIFLKQVAIEPSQMAVRHKPEGLADFIHGSDYKSKQEIFHEMPSRITAQPIVLLSKA